MYVIVVAEYPLINIEAETPVTEIKDVPVSVVLPTDPVKAD